MNYFDLHCDTVTAMADRKADCAIALSKIGAFERYTQAFAIWINDGVSPDIAFQKAGEYFTYFKEHILSSKSRVFTPFLTLENAVSFGDSLDNITVWKKRGVRAATLTWNGANALGYGASFPDAGGLTEFGKDALSEMNCLGILADVSHLNSNGFYDCISLSKAPVIATHSNCAALCPHKRNLDDEQLRALFSVGGLLGICYYPPFLGKGDVFELIYEHIYHALELGGENLVCFGSDFDGAIMDGKLSALQDVKKLRSYIARNGFDNELLDKLFFCNAQNFFNQF